MKKFTFLGEEPDLVPLPEDTPTWIWDDEGIITLIDNKYELVRGNYNGILDFLSQFPLGYVVVVNSITGVESGISHTAYSSRNGWGFNIQNDELIIVHYKFSDNGETELI